MAMGQQTRSDRWQPQIQPREGLKRTIDYFDLLLRAKKA
jgi:hypothetical protein